MKLYVVCFCAILILQSVAARPKPNKNGDDFENIDYPENGGGVLNQDKEYLNIAEEINVNSRVRRSWNWNKNNGNINTNLLTTTQNSLDSKNSFNNPRKQNGDVHNFIQQERQFNTVHNNDPVKASHKYYSCKIKGNVTNKNGPNTSSYDKIYYDFVKNTKANNYNLANVTVIHGYHGDIAPQTNLQANGNLNRNTGTVNNFYNSQKNNLTHVAPVNRNYIANVTQRNTLAPRNTNMAPRNTNVAPRNTMIPSRNLQNAYQSNSGIRNNPPPAPVEEIVTKKQVNKDECILVGNGCPQGMVRDPSGRFCLPDYSQMEDEPFLIEDYD